MVSTDLMTVTYQTYKGVGAELRFFIAGKPKSLIISPKD